MFRLRQITLTYFKSHEQSNFKFDEKIVGISGRNGVGKTNLLDAMYYSCFTKSYFTGNDALNVGFGKDGFRLQAIFEKHDKAEEVLCIHRGVKKEFSFNGDQYSKLSKHIGLLPAVVIAPDDIELINGASELRRKYIDAILCQLDAEYLQQLMVYNKIVQQRNSYLKQSAISGHYDDDLLETLNRQLFGPSQYIFAKRLECMNELAPLIEKIYHRLAKGDEQVNMIYQSQLHSAEMPELLKTHLKKDMALQRTTAGPHKDDIEFYLHNQPFKNIASQGQRKSLLFALKLAEFEIIKKHKGFAPILLLDDIFEKLDENRMNELLHIVCTENDGQVFITDTHAERLSNAMVKLGVKWQLIQLD